jgi:hypothetical protein
MSKELPNFHIAKKEGEIKKHGPHADGLARTSFGSDQFRVGPNGEIIGGQLNFKRDNEPATKWAWERFELDDRYKIDRNGVLTDRFMSNGMPDPRGTAMGGYNKY